MAHEFSSEDSQLIADLVALSKKSPKLVKSSAYPAPADPSLLVVSWKMNEFKYYDIPSPFPTYARGLFTLQLNPPEARYRIVARGYDKFFNIGEVPWTEWSFLESHTRPPYVLSLKSNGCIIFIAALTPSKLIVTSKHSVGPVEGYSRSHAQVGESWLRRYFDEKGRKEAEMAKQLWDNNWTAIAELCDDSFEEHILPYPPEKTGLYLHGLNASTKEFCTMPTSTVDAFAEEWGFLKTTSVTLKTIPEVRDFTDEIRKTGTWQQEPIEGFVVRTHVIDPPKSSSDSTSGTLPYKSGCTFFFKIKFDEPYLLYRDWREVTKSLLSMRAKTGHMNPNNLPKSKMRRDETKVYVNWAIGEIKRNPKAFDQYNNNKGIIKTREMFLEWLSSNPGMKPDHDAGKDQEEPKKPDQDEFVKTIIVPVAIPGSGKTAVSLALSHIFGFAHTQSDDVRASKKPGPVFVKNVMNLLRSHSVVIADKNNHLRQHRMILREESTNLLKKQKGKGLADGSESPGRVRLLALYWDISSKPAPFVFQTCADRVRARGANHQTLRADPSAPAPSQQPSGGNSHEPYEDVIWKFIRESHELSQAEVDAIIEMQLDESLEGNVKHAVNGIVQELRLPMPDEQKIQEGINKVKEYTVAEEAKRAEARGQEKTRKTPRYYGFLPELDFRALLDPVFQSVGVDADGTSFWNHLKKGRLISQPHVTIVHTKDLPDSQVLWDRCGKLIRDSAGHDVYFRLCLTHVIWNDRVMALAVEVVVPEGQGGSAQDLGAQYASSLAAPERQWLHITVGTRDGSILPVEAKALVKSWRSGEEDRERRTLKLGEGDIITVGARIAGLFN